jgi:PmbA protein
MRWLLVEEILEKIISQAKNFFVEAVVNKSSGETLVFEKQKLLYPQHAESESLMIRVTFPDGRTGVGSTLLLKDWRACLSKARKFAAVSAPNQQFKKIPGKKKSNKVVKFFDRDVENYDAEKLWEDANDMLTIAKEKKVGVQIVSASKTVGKEFFMNSEGACYSEENISISAGMSVVKNGFSGDEYQVFSRKPDFSGTAVKAVDKCLLSQKPMAIKSGILPLILEYDALVSLGEGILLNAADGYFVFKKKSFFTGKRGDKVCSSKLTLVDNPLIDYGLGSSVYDAEGVPCKEKNIVSNGVVKSFLQDTYTTLIRGKGVSGNCGSILSRPSISASNLVVKKGAASYDKILNSADNALLVKEVGGAHMVNMVSGDFSNEATKAFIVKKGELTPVKKAMISGNFFELLTNLELVGNDYKQKSALMAPTLFFSKVQVIS